jgi:hypothetical protein|tara:strand:- start:233 stop:610 length:378 start_codon:yes stop_codon:yes gene_type:complete
MIHNLGDKTFVLSLLPNDVVTTTGLGSAVDLEDYEGEMAVVLDAEAGGASITYAVKLQESDTSGGTYTDVTGGAFTTTDANTALVEKISVNTNDMKRFVKLSITVAGGTGAGAVSVVALASKKYG